MVLRPHVHLDPYLLVSSFHLLAYFTPVFFSVVIAWSSYYRQFMSCKCKVSESLILQDD